MAIGLQGKKNVGFETLEKHKSTIFSLLFLMMWQIFNDIFYIFFIGVFEIIRESQLQYPVICRKALESLADILGGLQPEELSNEPNTIIDPMFETLLELATIDSSDDDIRSLASCCLLRYAFFFQWNQIQPSL